MFYCLSKNSHPPIISSIKVVLGCVYMLWMILSMATKFGWPITSLLLYHNKILFAKVQKLFVLSFHSVYGGFDTLELINSTHLFSEIKSILAIALLFWSIFQVSFVTAITLIVELLRMK